MGALVGLAVLLALRAATTWGAPETHHRQPGPGIAVVATLAASRVAVPRARQSERAGDHRPALAWLAAQAESMRSQRSANRRGWRRPGTSRRSRAGFLTQDAHCQLADSTSADSIPGHLSTCSRSPRRTSPAAGMGGLGPSEQVVELEGTEGRQTPDRLGVRRAPARDKNLQWL